MGFQITGDPAADKVLDDSSFALLVGMMLDQQYPMEHAFRGPAKVLDRFGTFAPAAIATADPEEFAAMAATTPAIHRFPGSMATRVHDLAVHVRDRYDGDAARVWTEAATTDELRANLAALPGFGEMKIKALGAVLAKRFGVEPAQDLVPWHPTLGDVDSAQALADYQAAKRVHKAEWSKAKAPT
jgi:uncharacterized HhH-GPD family protein